MKRILVPAFLVIILAACSASATPPPTDFEQVADSTGSADSAIRTDQQGAVVIEITPVNLDAVEDTLEFDVTMNTHSVDLGMDLAALSTLTTDTGISLAATTWDAPSGGHHVSGKLTFPAKKNGKSILDGASQLTITILNVDAPTRVFEWELQ